ncbi:hypothetical protein [uncultured Helicobacter sp.]|uniref:glycoside hydrolase family protein n=1 Tax=uncultured Helicobacter sp. TaxID=175537 RepID=UPI002616B978|nr:hypothetical protein [uncultured Helicobacter sp.]
MASLEKVLEYITPKTAEFEGFSAKVYKCPAGFNTIGYGRNIEANPLNAQELAQLQNGEVSKEVALVWLKDELERCYYRACELAWFRDLDNVARAGAVVDMIYNLGFLGFKKFVKFGEAMRKQDYIKAVQELESSKWFKQVGFRAKAISKIIQLGC